MDILDTTKDILHFAYTVTEGRTSFLIPPPPDLTTRACPISSLPGCGLDLLTNLRFDGWREEKKSTLELLTSVISTSLRRISEHSPNITHLELRSTVMTYEDDDYEWLMSDTAFPRLEVMRLDATDIKDIDLGC